MLRQFKRWSPWDPVKSIMLGSCYSENFFAPVTVNFLQFNPTFLLQLKTKNLENPYKKFVVKQTKTLPLSKKYI